MWPNVSKLSHDAGKMDPAAQNASKIQQPPQTAGTGGIGSGAVLGHMVKFDKP